MALVSLRRCDVQRGWGICSEGEGERLSNTVSVGSVERRAVLM